MGDSPSTYSVGAHPHEESTLSSASQGFYPPPDSKALRRSLWLSGIASTLGAVFFTIVQGSVFNFFIEDMGLKDKLGIFMGLASLAGVGSLLGAWIQERYGGRKVLLLWVLGCGRLIWLAIGLLPVLWPEWKGDAVFWPLAGLVLLFFLTHSFGFTVWLSWMSELVPPDMQGKYWGLRQVGVSATATLARMGFGYYLELHHNPYGYLAIFAFSTVLGVVDTLLYIPILHREPKRMQKNESMWGALARCMSDVGLRRLSATYLFWMLSNCVMGATLFRFLRDYQSMGVFAISMIEMITLACFTVFSLLWGTFSDRHGHRGALVTCLIIHSLCPLPYFFAGPNDWGLAGLAFVSGSIGFCGITLFMFPMLIRYTTRQTSGRAVGIAVFNVLLGVPSFVMFWMTDAVLRPGFTTLLGADNPDGQAVCLALIACSMALRVAAVVAAWRLPECASETPPSRVLQLFATTNPIRAAWHLVHWGTVGWRKGEAGPFAKPTGSPGLPKSTTCK